MAASRPLWALSENPKLWEWPIIRHPERPGRITRGSCRGSNAWATRSSTGARSGSGAGSTWRD
eukprot:3845412-Prymnesium_polylepis.1